MKRQLMKIQEAADYLGVHKNTLANWIRSNRKITFMRDPVTGYVYFEKKDLDAYMQNLKVTRE